MDRAIDFVTICFDSYFFDTSLGMTLALISQLIRTKRVGLEKELKYHGMSKMSQSDGYRTIQGSL